MTGAELRAVRALHGCVAAAQLVPGGGPRRENGRGRVGGATGRPPTPPPGYDGGGFGFSVGDGSFFFDGGCLLLGMRVSCTFFQRGCRLDEFERGGRII